MFDDLLKVQEALDAKILADKPPMDVQERLSKTFTAFYVEVAEVANVKETFKFWKDSRGDKVSADRYVEISKDEYWDLELSKTVDLKTANHATAVEEASDALHFLLSLHNQAKLTSLDTVPYLAENEGDPNLIYLVLIASPVHDLYSINTLFFRYLKLLDITQEELREAYLKKNKINYDRLRGGY